MMVNNLRMLVVSIHPLKNDGVKVSWDDDIFPIYIYMYIYIYVYICIYMYIYMEK